MVIITVGYDQEVDLSALAILNPSSVRPVRPRHNHVHLFDQNPTFPIDYYKKLI